MFNIQNYLHRILHAKLFRSLVAVSTSQQFLITKHFSVNSVDFLVETEIWWRWNIPYRTYFAFDILFYTWRFWISFFNFFVVLLFFLFQCIVLIAAQKRFTLSFVLFSFFCFVWQFFFFIFWCRNVEAQKIQFVFTSTQHTTPIWNEWESFAIRLKDLFHFQYFSMSFYCWALFTNWNCLRVCVCMSALAYVCMCTIFQSQNRFFH